MRAGGIRNGFLWTAFLSIVVAVTVACGGAGDRGEEIVAGRKATTVPAATVERTSATTITMPTATIVPTAPTAPTVTIMPTESFEPAPTATPPAPTVTTGPLHSDSLLAALRSGGYVIYFRHAATDPLPDDADPVDLSDCSTQRNLSEDGREQSLQIGQAIERLEIPIGEVLSSPFCRALDTARLAFGKASVEPELENLETADSEAEREARIEGLLRLLSAPPEAGTNRVLVGHGFNISGAAEISIAEGEAAVFLPEGDGRFTLVETVKSSEWGELALVDEP